MKLQQLRFLAAVAQSDLNLTTAAARLSTTQPAVSKQLKALEDELGFRIFARRGRAFTGVTTPGRQVVAHALRALREVQNIKGLSEEISNRDKGALSIGTTHTQARYILPPIIREFCSLYPQVEFHLHQGTAEQIAEMGKLGHIDFAIATGSQDLFGAYTVIPWYRWRRRIIVPRSHPLVGKSPVTLEALALHPIVTYVSSLSGPSSLAETFARAGLTPKIALTARDSDVIKTYVRLGLGVGIIAGMALNPEEDFDLVTIDADNLLPIHTSWIGFPRNSLLRQYMYAFLQLLAPHLTHRLIDSAAAAATPQEITALLAEVPLALR